MDKRGRINLNAASLDQLARVTGFDEELAAEIVAYRARKGAFQSIEQLADVGPLPGLTLEELEREIYV